MNDLQIHHKLQNRVTQLENRIVVLSKLAVKHRKAVRYLTVTKDDKIERGKRSIKAKTLLELKLTGVIEWDFKRIADECFLTKQVVLDINCKMKRDQK